MIKDFTMTGGLRTEYIGAAFPFNMTNASWPFASLTATESGILLRSFKIMYDVKKYKINEMSKHRGLFSVGLKISHSMENTPPSFIFWTFNFKKLKQNWEQLGYEVTI